MKVDVKVKTVFKNSGSPLKATANIILDDCFVVRNIRLIDNGNSMLVSMPSLRGSHENWRSICYPATQECRELIKNAVINAYQQA